MLLKTLVLLAVTLSIVLAENAFLEDCNLSLFKCCSDGKTEAMGRAKEGCGVALCEDLKPTAECIKKKRKGYCSKGRYGDTDYNTAIIMTRDCAKTCSLCKHHAPRRCESTEFGCCWDGSTARGSDKTSPRNCPPCYDRYSSFCPRHKDECKTSKGPRTRKFLKDYCKASCNIC